MPFSESTRIKVLLWCDRHCCLCKKPCGVNIEIHHIVQDGSDDIDNAIPLCFDCHSEVMRYNTDHPKGTKYKPQELKTRREQVYEEFTRHLVPPLHYQITQQLPNGRTREFPDVGFVLTHLGDSLPVRVRVVLGIVEDDGGLKVFKPNSHYSGDNFWRLNPRFQLWGHFYIPQEARNRDPLKLQINVSIIDQYERQHLHLPVEYVYAPDRNSWYLEP